MKNFVLMCLVALCGIFASCEKEDNIIINIERVPCTFHPSSFEASVDEKPMTRVTTTSAPRQIKFFIDYANSSIKDTAGIVDENTLLEINLIKNQQFTYYFVYDDAYETGDEIRINSKNTYYATKTMSISNPINESVVLTRESAEFIAKQGHIPSNTTLHVQMTVKNYFNWKTNAMAETETYAEQTFTNEHLAYNAWLRGGVKDGVTVYVALKNSHGKVVKSGTYTYTIPVNKIRTVTYNINNINENGDGFFVSIDDTPMSNVEGEDDNQQVGK